MSKHRPLEYSWNQYGFWVRVFGYGFSAVNANQYKMTFTERNHLVKTIEFAGMRWRRLKPLTHMR